MSNVARFGISIEEGLLKKFDEYIKNEKYANRSEAIRDLISGKLIKEEWERGGEVAGAITLVYDHHKRELVNTLTDVQHNYGDIIISTQHIHLDHNNCLEVIVIKGISTKIRELFKVLRAIKGINHSALNMTTTGK